MQPGEWDFLREFYQSVTDHAIDFDDPVDSKRYVPLYEDPALIDHDPVRQLARPIYFTPGETVQLFSGFRGCGKSTELRRLRRYLGNDGYKVVLCDVEDYLNLAQPLDISDFLMVLAGAFGDGLYQAGHIKGDPAAEGYWARLWNFLNRTEVNFAELPSAGSGLRTALKDNPTFREKLRKFVTGHLDALVKDMRKFIEDCVKRVKAEHGANTEVVLLVDSLEHLRGTTVTAEAVQSSVENLFAQHAEKLHLPYVHVVYTIPPYLKVLYPNLGNLYAPGGVQVLPTVKVRDRDTGDLFKPGLDLLERVIAGRGEWRRLLGDDRAALDSLSAISGGHLRDLLRLFSEIIRRAERLPVPAHIVEVAVNQIRSEFLPLADNDAVWLKKIGETHGVALVDKDRLHDLLRFFGRRFVIWSDRAGELYDLHPIISNEVLSNSRSSRLSLDVQQ